MIPSIPQPRAFRAIYTAYVIAFFIYLGAPLIVVGIFAFNDSSFPSPPWGGFTLDWFISDKSPRIGMFYDSALTESIGISVFVAFFVTILSLIAGTFNAFLFERESFRFKNFLYMLMLLPLVIPGVILGISVLVFSSNVVNSLEAATGFDIEALRPGLVLVVLGQFAFIATITTLIISARLKRFDRTLEEAALNLGATKFEAIRTITLSYLKPAFFGSGIVAFLMSFENFNTTLMLVGSDAPLTITMFTRLREGSTPVLNAVSLLLVVVSAILAVTMIMSMAKNREN